jgi:hypothetical protein
MSSTGAWNADDKSMQLFLMTQHDDHDTNQTGRGA